MEGIPKGPAITKFRSYVLLNLVPGSMGDRCQTVTFRCDSDTQQKKMTMLQLYSNMPLALLLLLLLGMSAQQHRCMTRTTCRLYNTSARRARSADESASSTRWRRPSAASTRLASACSRSARPPSPAGTSSIYRQWSRGRRSAAIPTTSSSSTAMAGLSSMCHQPWSRYSQMSAVLGTAGWWACFTLLAANV